MTSVKLYEWADEAAKQFLAGTASAEDCFQALRFFTRGNDRAFAYAISQFCNIIDTNHAVLFRIGLSNDIDRGET